VARRTEAMETSDMADGVYFGLMSGTSMDGVDGIAVQFTAGQPPVVLGEAHVGFSQGLRDALFALQAPGAMNWNAKPSRRTRWPRATLCVVTNWPA